MLMRKQMILAVFIISIAFGAETEHQIIPVLFRAAADRAFMSSRVLLSLLYTLRIRPPAVNLFRIITAHIPHSKEENQEVGAYSAFQRRKSGSSARIREPSLH